MELVIMLVFLGGASLQAVATVHKQSRASALHSIVQLPSEADAEADANDSDTDADGSRGPGDE